MEVIHKKKHSYITVESEKLPPTHKDYTKQLPVHIIRQWYGIMTTSITHRYPQQMTIDGRLMEITWFQSQQGIPQPQEPLPQLIKRVCKKSQCMSHCSCRPQHLNCSEMCICVGQMKRSVRHCWGSTMMMTKMETL